MQKGKGIKDFKIKDIYFLDFRLETPSLPINKCTYIFYESILFFVHISYKKGRKWIEIE